MPPNFLNIDPQVVNTTIALWISMHHQELESSMHSSNTSRGDNQQIEHVQQKYIFSTSSLQWFYIIAFVILFYICVANSLHSMN